MRKRKMINLLSRYADRLVGVQTEDDLTHLTASDAAQISPYMHLSGQLKAALQPVSPASEFRSRLRTELMAAAARNKELVVRVEPAPIWQNRWVLVGAAAGSVLSVAGVLTAVLLHQRSVAHSKL